MKLKIHKKGLFLVWEDGASVPAWAWDIAGFYRFSIACYDGYENALHFRF